MAADGSIVIEVELNDNNARRGIRNLENEANRTGSVFQGLGKAIAAVGASILGAKLISSVKDFTVNAVQAAGAIQALNAQFGQVFGSFEDEARESLNNISNETNILPGRLQGAFTQIAAFARTAGFDSSQALELTSRATLAAADAAAFYDRSIESVTESLQSYLKGNFENDAALGFASTETTRNTVANELYGKSFIELSEAQKQLTLLTQVEQANALGGALGQAAREGNGLENVQGNLNQAFRDFQAAVGENFLESAVAGIVALTVAIQELDTERIGNALGILVNLFLDIANLAIPLVLSAINLFLTTVEFVVNAIAPVVDTLRNIWQSNSEQISNVVTNAFNLVRDTIQTVVNAILNFVRPQLDNLRKFWEENGQAILQAVSNAFNAIKAVIDFIMPAIRLVIEVVWGAIQQVITGALNVIQGAIQIFTAIFTGDWRRLWDGILQLLRGVVDLVLGLLTLSFFGGIRTILTRLLTSGLNIIRQLGTGIVNVFKNFITNTVSSVSSFVVNVVNFFKNLVVRVLQNISQLRENALKYFVDIATSIVNTLQQLPAKLLEIGKNIIQGLIDGLKSLNPIKVIQDIGEGILTTLGIIFSGKKAMAAGEEVGNSVAAGVKKTAPKAIKATEIYFDDALTVQKDYVDDTQRLTLADVKGLEDSEKKKKSTREKANKDSKSADEIYLEQLEQRVRNGRKFGNLTVTDEIELWRGALSALTNGSNEYLEARNNFNNAVIERFEQRKQAGEVSIEDEIEFWRQALEQFTIGSDQYIQAQRNYNDANERLLKQQEEAQKAYQDRVKTINDNVVKINEDYQKRIQDINKKLLEDEKKLTDEYNKAYEERYKALNNFSGLFDSFEVDTEVTGRGLLNNLQQQVDGFQNWQVQIDTLSKRAIDDGLLAELRKLGPSALSELIALNSLTDSELQKYSDLFYIRSNNARLQTEKELYKLRVNTGVEIAQLRSIALVELDELEREWINVISNVVNETESELSSLYDVGVQASQDLLDGIISLEGSLVSRAAAIGQAVSAALQSALSAVQGPSVNLSGALNSPIVNNGSGILNSNAGLGGKTQINNITVETNNQKVELERIMRQNTFAF